jgi:hypothetical protein
LAACCAVALTCGAAISTAAVTCGPATYTQPFMPWGDPGSYLLAPGGSFEGANGWNLSGGAKIVNGNEPFFLNSRADSHSLLLGAGGSATSPAACLDANSPTLRFVGKSSDSSPVHVDIYAAGVLGVVKLPWSTEISLSTSWNPSAIQLLTLQQVLALTNLGTTSIVLRFSPVGSATVQLDDVYIDPVFHE